MLLYGSNKTLILYDTLGFSKKSNWWFARLADQAGNSLVTKAIVVRTTVRVVDKVWNF
jgi:hypothetical protein